MTLSEVLGRHREEILDEWGRRASLRAGARAVRGDDVHALLARLTSCAETGSASCEKSELELLRDCVLERWLAAHAGGAAPRAEDLVALLGTLDGILREAAGRQAAEANAAEPARTARAKLLAALEAVTVATADAELDAALLKILRAAASVGGARSGSLVLRPEARTLATADFDDRGRAHRADGHAAAAAAPDAPAATPPASTLELSLAHAGTVQGTLRLEHARGLEGPDLEVLHHLAPSLGSALAALAARAREREERERVEAVIESLAAAVCVVEKSGTVRRANAEARRLLGAVVGKAHQLSSLTDARSRSVDPTAHPLTRALAGETCRGVRLRVPAEEPRQEPRILAFSASPLVMGEAAQGAAVLLAHDVSEETLAASERERFLAILGHDLRNPLQAIRLQAALLERATSPLETATLARKIRGTSRRLARMVEQLLDLARAREGRDLELDTREVDLRDVVDAAVEELGPLTQGNLIRVSVRGDSRGVWDADRLHQAVANLVSNASAYSESGGAIDVTIVGEREGEVELLVADHGSGIATDQIARIFHPFVRGTHAVTPRNAPSGSLGLGLYIVQLVVSAHGGAIAVDSALGRGTTFTVRLPRRVASARTGSGRIKTSGPGPQAGTGAR